jgi:selenocysteine lyase/cysteine desulfurase
VRAGLHCAPMAHRSGGTLETGTVRVSFSAFNTSAEVRQFLQVCRTAFLPG